MVSRPSFSTEVCIKLLQTWVAMAFPEPRKAEDAKKLREVWETLAQALCGSDKQKLAMLNTELEELALAGREGEPPIQALKQQLGELERAGMQEGFLAVIVREAMEVLIIRDLPAAWDWWTQLVDMHVPKGMRFLQSGDRIGFMTAYAALRRQEPAHPLEPGERPDNMTTYAPDQ